MIPHRHLCHAVGREKEKEKEQKHKQPNICIVLAGDGGTTSPATLSAVNDSNE